MRESYRNLTHFLPFFFLFCFKKVMTFQGVGRCCRWLRPCIWILHISTNLITLIHGDGRSVEFSSPFEILIINMRSYEFPFPRLLPPCLDIVLIASGYTINSLLGCLDTFQRLKRIQLMIFILFFVIFFSFFFVIGIVF